MPFRASSGEKQSGRVRAPEGAKSFPWSDCSKDNQKSIAEREGESAVVAIMSHNNFKLEQLFKRCDTRGDGFIGQKEFRDLCRDFGIENGDADTIFYDLDHDGDGSISFEDFAFGFRDFVTPGARRGSIQLELARQPSIRESESNSVSRG